MKSWELGWRRRATSLSVDGTCYQGGEEGLPPRNSGTAPARYSFNFRPTCTNTVILYSPAAVYRPARSTLYYRTNRAQHLYKNIELDPEPPALPADHKQTGARRVYADSAIHRDVRIVEVHVALESGRPRAQHRSIVTTRNGLDNSFNLKALDPQKTKKWFDIRACRGTEQGSFGGPCMAKQVARGSDFQGKT